MTLKAFTAFALAGLAAFQVAAQEAEAAPEENKELEAEISYVEALVNYGYPDLAGPVIEVTKKRWPESEARFFAIEIRSMLSLGKFAEAEKKIAALPDRKSSKYWAARLEVANNYFGRGQKPECMKIYNEFFKLFPKPPKDIRKFYMDASYAYGQLLVGDKQYAAAARIYNNLLTQLKGEEWCNIAVETVEIYLRLAESQTDAKHAKTREENLAAATKIVDKLLWQQDSPVLFGRAVAMKAHIEQIRGDIEKASTIIDEYMGQLRDIHDQIVQVDPEGKFGLLRQSPLPECRYLQAKMRWDEAKMLSEQPKPDDDKIKALLFGPRGKGGKRIGAKGAFNISVAVFLNYETSAWAPVAGDLSEEIKKFAEKRYNAKIRTKVTPEQIAKVRAAQFKSATELFAAGDYLKAIDAYGDVLAKYPELLESIQAVENVASSYIDLILQSKDAKLKEEYRLNADAVEGYLAERFAGSGSKAIMSAAGDAVIRLAAKEQEYRNFASADRLYMLFFTNYRKHTASATLAAAKAMELQRSERYSDAVRYWGIICQYYTNTAMYASALAQLSACNGKLGDSAAEIDCMSRYVSVEKVKIRKLQAQFRLAQMYQREGLKMLDGAATNTVADAVEAAERQGTAEIIKAIRQFSGFTAAANEALADPSTPKGDIAKYKELKEAAAFIVGECWSRMNRPEKHLATYRAKAAESYEKYLAEYPEGKWAKVGYVKLGTIYTAIGDMAKSKDALDRLSRKFPESDEAKNAKPRLAKSLIEMGMRREGAEIYGEMLRTDGAYTAQQFVNAGEALIEAKNWDLANQAFEKAVRMAGTNSLATVARARLGQARSSFRQGSLAEAREALDRFLQDPKLSRLSLAADANFMLVEVASDQGRAEKDAIMRGKYFGAAIGALKKVRQYWGGKPRWEQDKLDILSGEVLIDRMKAEESMGLKEESLETCGRAAATFQVFIQAHGVTEDHPLDKMADGEKVNLERAYAAIVPLFSKMGADKADLVMRFGKEYLDLFPEGKNRTEISNCMNKAKADLPAK
ncbi:MAG: tetratricopeptide repeat protein [Kiritimatiellae bacterium]|nr:tetratricopeptide repeat protein [Kiritimatiellia bacterium]